MATDDKTEKPLEQILETPHLADALESDRFKQFLDHIPFGIVVSELQPEERITYANIEFERLTAQAAAEVHGKDWNSTMAMAVAPDGQTLSEAIATADDYIGTFTIPKGEETIAVDAWSNIILDDDGTAMFRLVGLADVSARPASEDLEQRIKEKDTLMRELQHRVKNNLQMITALIRMETRNLPEGSTGERFDRLAGRVDSLALLYRSLAEDGSGDIVDLGIYLSQIAAAVMRAHAVEGIRLDLKVDTWPVSVNVAMPTGLVVNELLTNALKHAFVNGEGGTITLHSLVDDAGCLVTVADDGVGLPEDVAWPKDGKLSALIVRSLRQNALAQVDVKSAPGKGMRVSIRFARVDAAPKATE